MQPYGNTHRLSLLRILLSAGYIEANNCRACRHSLRYVSLANWTHSSVEKLDLEVLPYDLICLSEQRLQTTSLVGLDNQWVVSLLILVLTEHGLQLGTLSLYLQLFFLV